MSSRPLHSPPAVVELSSSVSGAMDARRRGSRGGHLGARIARLEAIMNARISDGNRLDALTAENARLKLRVAVVEARLKAAECALAARDAPAALPSAEPVRPESPPPRVDLAECASKTATKAADTSDDDDLSPHLHNLSLTEPDAAPTPPGSSVTVTSASQPVSRSSPPGGLRARLKRAITLLNAEPRGSEHPPSDGDPLWTTRYFDSLSDAWVEDADACAERRARRTVEDERSAYSPLTRTARHRLRHTANEASNAARVLVNIGGCRIRGCDLALLTPRTWLNDEIVNAYMQLLVRRSQRRVAEEDGDEALTVRAASSFFYAKLVAHDARTGERAYDYARVRKWSRRYDVFTCDLLLVPVNMNNSHWSLAVVNVRERRVEMFDSMGGRCADEVMGHLLRWVWDERDRRKGEKADGMGWEMLDMSGRVPQQDNGDDCGVFACKYADFLARGAEINFSSRHINYFRARIAHELLMERVA